MGERLDEKASLGDPRLDHTILEQARNLHAALEALEKIQRCGVAWESSRAVRNTLYALGDLIRLEERSLGQDERHRLNEI